MNRASSNRCLSHDELEDITGSATSNQIAQTAQEKLRVNLCWETAPSVNAG